MNNKLFFTYALAKTLYEQRKDYIDTFCPFLLKVLPSNLDSLNLVSIQEKIKEDYGLSIPEHSLKSIITRAKKKGYVTVERWQAKLAETGVRYLDRLEPETDVNRRINELLEDVRSYLNDPQLSLEEINAIISRFINENIEPVLEFFEPSGIHRLDVPQIKIQKYERKLVQYFELAEKQKPRFWQTLQDIVYGSVISISAMSPNIAEMNKKFKDFQVFLDSNFMFSLFEFHFPEMNKPAKELFELLKIYKFDLKIFDFTVNEMVSVLSNYSREQYMYVPDIKVNSIYSNLKSKGWTVEDIKEFIQKIEEKIWNLGIKIELSDIDLMTYEPKKEYIDSILKYKPLQPYQTERVRYHDLAAIEKIKEIRSSPKREIESSRVIFLTSDLKLSRCNFFEMGHKEKATICEVIPDRLLTNILWLKNPTIVRDIPLKTIIAIHSREIFVDRKIWRRFYDNVRKLRQEARINDKDISMLFYNKHIEEVLLKLDESDIDKLTPELILEEIEKMTKIIDVETQRKLEGQKRIFEEKITQEIEKQKEWEIKLERIKEQIKTKSERKATIYANCWLWSITLFVIVTLFVIIKGIIGLWKNAEPYAWVISFIISVLSLFGIKIKFRELKRGLHSRLFNRIYRKNLNELNLAE